MSQNDIFKLCSILLKLGKSTIFTQSQNMWTRQLYVDVFSKRMCFQEFDKFECYFNRGNFTINLFVRMEHISVKTCALVQILCNNY